MTPAISSDAVARGQGRGEISPDLDPMSVAYVVWSLYLGLEAQETWQPQIDHHAYAQAAAAMLAGTFVKQ